jgi:GxxExxY protein
MEYAQLHCEIIQAARTVHDSLGPGFVEQVYGKAFQFELRNRQLLVEREKLVRVIYASQIVGRHYLDLVVEDRMILELKATRAISPVFKAQMRSYLAATSYEMGLIINFGTIHLEWVEVTRFD